MKTRLLIVLLLFYIRARSKIFATDGRQIIQPVAGWGLPWAQVGGAGRDESLRPFCDIGRAEVTVERKSEKRESGNRETGCRKGFYRKQR